MLHVKTIRTIMAALCVLCLSGCGYSGAELGLSALTNNVVFIGDSITDHWRDAPLFDQHVNWIDKGISGQTSQQIAARFATDVIGLAPKTVYIMAGTNDVYPGWSLCSSGSDTTPGVVAINYSWDTCTNLFYMVELAKRNGIKVVISTIPPWGCSDIQICGPNLPDNTPARYQRIDALNAWIKKLAVAEHVTLIDFHTTLADSTNLHYVNALTVDGVHPSPSAYTIMTPIAEAAVE